MADHPNQKSMSSYQYVWGNPVSLTDPDGKCPQCLWQLAKRAAIGAAVEITTQVTVSVIKGESLRDAVKNIDYADVAASAVEGVVIGEGGMLVNSGKKILAVAASEVFQAAVDVTASQGVDHVMQEDSEKSWSQVAWDSTVGVAAGKVGEVVASAHKVMKNTEPLDQLKRIKVQLRPSRALKGSKGEAVRLKRKASIERTIKVNEVSGDLIGTGVTETIEDVGKGKVQ